MNQPKFFIHCNKLMTEYIYSFFKGYYEKQIEQWVDARERERAIYNFVIELV
jgi:hypothetical protein